MVSVKVNSGKLIKSKNVKSICQTLEAKNVNNHEQYPEKE